MVKSKLSYINKYTILIIGIISLFFTTGIPDGKYNPTIFSMFTTMSNLFVVVYYLCDLIYLRKHNNNLLPIIKQMATLSISLTLVVVIFVLKMGFSTKTFFEFAFLGLHFIVPILTIIDLIFFDKKGEMKWYYPLVWTFPGLFYFLGCLILKVYPYDFLNVEKIGMTNVIFNNVIIAIFIILMGYGFYFLDKLLTKKDE